jgi:DNA repair exonuclease SbcCD ATPase subunit
MHITRLEVENVKRVSAVEIIPNGNMVIIGGKNGQGKSSVLDSIVYALNGKRSLPDVPIHKGADKAQIVLHTDKYIIKRTFTEKGSYIEVTNSEGFKANSPQELLDTLYGDLTFDPLAFTRMDAKKQAVTLMNLLGLDFSELDAKFAQLTAERRDIGRDGEQVKALLNSIPEDKDAPTEEVVVSELMNKLVEANQTNDANEQTRLRIGQCEQHVSKCEQYVTQQKEAIADLEERLNAAKAALPEYENGVKKAQDALKKAQETASKCVDVDTAPITEQINNAQAINKRVQSQAQRAQYATRYKTLADAYKAKTEALEAINAEKAKQIASAKFPVPNVAFSADGIVVNDLPFSQASTAEQLRIAVAMGFASDPQLKIILIREGSALDEDSLKLVAELAEQYEATVWMERVGSGEEVSVVIEDGMVKEDRTKTDEQPTLEEVA